MTEKLTNQTIKHILGDIHQDIKEIKEMATKTNGRIKSLEIWRARIAGALIIISLILAPIVAQFATKIVWAYFK